MSENISAQHDPNDIRPVVATAAPNNWGMWGFFGVLAIGGVMLFNALNANREASLAPSTLAPREAGPGAQIASPPPLGLPQHFLEPAQPRVIEEPVRPSAPPVSYTPIPLAPPQPYVPPAPLPQPERVVEPRVVFDQTSRVSAQEQSASAAETDERVTASRFANPSRTIPKGTVIAAVLETAIDSTRNGAVRALVQRDVYAFDGSRVLIPRGTRLYGEYEADLQSGQNRAAISWERLLRPDGVTMNLNSPASDPLGRAGVKGKVDGKFWQRFGGAILQSVLDIGVGVATREATDGVIVALPGSTQNVTQSVGPGDIRPTLKVRHGASVSVFVARDLDFSSVEP